MNAYMFQVTKRRNSTWAPATADGYAFTLALKDTTDVVRPNFEVQGLSRPWTGNYIYVPEFSRYYFVDRWEVSGPYWVAHCTVDVLASFKAQIEGTEKYILRSASMPSRYIPDNLYPISTKVSHTYQSRSFGWSHGFSTGWYVVGLIGHDTTATSPGGDVYAGINVGSVRYWVMSAQQLNYLVDYMLSGLTNTNWSDSSNLANNVARMLADPLQYIVSCMWFPVKPPVVKDAQGNELVYPITFGFFDAMRATTPPTPITGNLLGQAMESKKYYMDIGDLSGYKEDLRNDKYIWAWAEPFSSYVLQMNPWGTFPLPSEFIMRKKWLCFTVKLDYITGIALCNVYTQGDKDHIVNDTDTDFLDWDVPSGTIEGRLNIVTSKSAQVGVQIQLSQNTSSILSPLNAASSTIGAAVAGGMAGGVFGAIAGGVLGGGGNLVGALSDKFSSLGSNGGISGNEGEPVLHVYRRSLAMPSAEISPGVYDLRIAELGTTCGAWTRIGDIVGYCQCADGELACTALADEKQMIADFLTGGFYVEN